MSLNGAARAGFDFAVAVAKVGPVVPAAFGEIQQKTPLQPAHRQVELTKRGKRRRAQKRRGGKCVTSQTVRGMMSTSADHR